MPVELTRSRKLANLATAIDSASSGSILKKGTEQGEYVSVSLSDVSGVPTFLDSSSATTIIDSSYIQTRQSGGGGTAFDSSTLTSLVDSNYITSRFSNGNSGFKLYRYNATAGQTTFQDSDRKGNILSYTVGGVKVFYNGVSLLDTEFTADDGSSVVLDSAASLNAKIQIAKWNVPSSGGASGIAWGGERGLIGGGLNADVVRTNVIQYITIATPGNATDFGDLTVGRQELAAVSNSTRAVFGGGDIGSSPVLDTMDYVTTATTGNATDFGDLAGVRQALAGCGDGTYGVFGGGDNYNYKQNRIHLITVESTGNASDFGDLSIARTKLAAVNDATYGVWAGGDTGSISNVIDYVPMATTGNATDFGDLSAAKENNTGVGDATRGCFAGGNTSGQFDTIEYITIATTGNTTDFGDLSETKTGMGTTGCSDGTYGTFQGGYNGSARVNTIEYITVQTTGNSTDFGDLLIGGQVHAGASGNAS